MGAESSKFGHGSTRLQAELEREPARADRSMKFDALEVASKLARGNTNYAGSTPILNRPFLAISVRHFSASFCEHPDRVGQNFLQSVRTLDRT